MKDEIIGVVGAGSWGTSIAQLLAEKGYRVRLWVYEPELCEIIREKRENTYYLPGYRLNSNIESYTDIEQVVRGRQLIVMVVPSHVYRSVALRMIPFMEDSVIVVSATKGIENETLLTMEGVWKDILPVNKRLRFSCIAGPSFAKEVIRKIPTAVTVASHEEEIARKVQRLFATDYFRVYTSEDVVGLELAGAIKNVIAIAAGMCDGMGFGHNTRAALITRGLAEMARLGVRLGAHPLTFSGLAGIGDLLLTCTGDLSRNRTVGYLIGQGKKLETILSEMRMVAEGVKTAKSVYFLAKKVGVEMPICEQVYLILYENQDPREAVKTLMTRALKHELEHHREIIMRNQC
ncbi:MAG: NAD(P)H-dependent glycerol-3-phosphate dehydrogenase [Syntrophobacterales bacterium]|nr:NAD(P)H-dependent glycerol-3-phosphate dehydrogenase [Syntrophobacterales bacterium]